MKKLYKVLVVTKMQSQRKLNFLKELNWHIDKTFYVLKPNMYICIDTKSKRVFFHDPLNLAKEVSHWEFNNLVAPGSPKNKEEVKKTASGIAKLFSVLTCPNCSKTTTLNKKE